MTLDQIIAHENPYPCQCHQRRIVSVERYGVGAPFDQNVPFHDVELSLHDPHYFEGVFVALGSPGNPRLTTTHRMPKVCRIVFECGHALIFGAEGGGGGM